MSKVLRVIVFLALFLAPSLSFAETKIAVVDMQKLMTQSDAAKDIQKQADDYKTKFLADISKQEQSLRAEEKGLAEKQSSTPKDEFAKKVKAFEEEVMKTRKDAQAKKKKLDDALEKAAIALRDKIASVTQGVAKDKGYNLVIARQSVVVGEDTLDITPDVLKGLNAAVSKMPLTLAK